MEALRGGPASTPDSRALSQGGNPRNSPAERRPPHPLSIPGYRSSLPPPQPPPRIRCPLRLTVLGLLMKIFVFPKVTSSEVQALSSPRIFSTPSLREQKGKAARGQPRGGDSPPSSSPFHPGRRVQGLNKKTSLSLLPPCGPALSFSTPH